MTLHGWMNGWMDLSHSSKRDVCVSVSACVCVCLALCRVFLDISLPAVCVYACVWLDGWILSVFKPVCSPTHSPDQSVSQPCDDVSGSRDGWAGGRLCFGLRLVCSLYVCVCLPFYHGEHSSTRHHSGRGLRCVRRRLASADLHTRHPDELPESHFTHGGRGEGRWGEVGRERDDLYPPG